MIGMTHVIRSITITITTMGSGQSSTQSGSSHCSTNKCYGRDACGLNQHCYTTGYDHGSSSSPDILGHAMAAAPCTTNSNANKCYDQGYSDAMNPSGVAGGETHGNGTSERQNSGYRKYNELANAHGDQIFEVRESNLAKARLNRQYCGGKK
jgi:hypothetical protein